MREAEESEGCEGPRPGDEVFSFFSSTGDGGAPCPMERSTNLTFSWQNNILKYQVNRSVIKRKVCRGIYNSDKHSLSTKQQASSRCLRSSP